MDLPSNSDPALRQPWAADNVVNEESNAQLQAVQPGEQLAVAAADGSTADRPEPGQDWESSWRGAVGVEASPACAPAAAPSDSCARAVGLPAAEAPPAPLCDPAADQLATAGLQAAETPAVEPAAPAAGGADDGGSDVAGGGDKDRDSWFSSDDEGELAAASGADGDAATALPPAAAPAADDAGPPPGITHHKGVSWHRSSRAWQVMICKKGVRKYLGTFDRHEDAVDAYNQAVGGRKYRPHGAACDGATSTDGSPAPAAAHAQGSAAVPRAAAAWPRSGLSLSATIANLSTGGPTAPLYASSSSLPPEAETLTAADGGGAAASRRRKQPDRFKDFEELKDTDVKPNRKHRSSDDGGGFGDFLLPPGADHRQYEFHYRHDPTAPDPLDPQLTGAPGAVVERATSESDDTMQEIRTQ